MKADHVRVMRKKRHVLPENMCGQVHVYCAHVRQRLFLQCVSNTLRGTLYMDTATNGNTRQHTATHGNTWQHTATHGNTRQHTATHGNTRQHTATHGNTQQHAATHGYTRKLLLAHAVMTQRYCEISHSVYWHPDKHQADLDSGPPGTPRFIVKVNYDSSVGSHRGLQHPHCRTHCHKKKVGASRRRTLDIKYKMC